MDTRFQILGPFRVTDADGGEIPLGDSGESIRPEQSPELANHVGHELITTDGTTLLGADDKAGVAEIMAAVAYLKRNPGVPHAPIRVCFTVDEEVAGGAEHLDLERFGAKFAYTLDGAAPGEIEAETFNAAKVVVTIRGRSTHTGTAKGQLVNAIKLAADFVASLPRDSLSPETTEEREGFVHPTKISGGAEETSVELIVRDHDLAPGPLGGLDQGVDVREVAVTADDEHLHLIRRPGNDGRS